MGARVFASAALSDQVATWHERLLNMNAMILASPFHSSINGLETANYRDSNLSIVNHMHDDNYEHGMHILQLH